MRAETTSPFVQSDAEKCIGCRTCEIACAAAHTSSKAATAGATTETLLPRLFVVVTTETAAAVNCHHCEDAPCLGICQMAAISKLNGRTVVDAARCVGCRLCLMACPFGAIEFVPQPSGTRPVYSGDFSKSQERAGRRFLRAGTCDLCINRSAGPACIETCAQKALELVNTAAEKSRRNVEAALDLLQVGASAGEWQLNKESSR